MIEKYVRYGARCDTCKGVMDFEVDRSAKVLSGLRKCNWRIEGRKLTCPDCIRREKERQEEERAREKEKGKLCPKCGERLAHVYESGKKIGVYCAECKEERLDA